LNFQKPLLSGCLRHNNYLYVKFQSDPLIHQSVSQVTALYNIHITDNKIQYI